MAPPRRRPLTRTAVIAEAISLADAEGLEGLSMRRLAARLGVEAMSLYNHVSDKSDLTAEMLDGVAGRFVLPGDGPWRDEVHTAAHGILATLAAHPWALALWAGQPAGPRRTAHRQALGDRLAEIGLDPDTARAGADAICALAIGAAMQGATSEDDLDFGLTQILDGLEALSAGEDA